MVRRNGFLLLSVMVALSACAGHKRPAAIAVEAEETPITWRDTIAPQDRATIDTLPQRLADFGTKVPARQRLAQGALLDPAAALDHVTLPPGAYHCRVLRIARKVLRKGAADFCHISGAPEGLGFVKQTGTAPTAGYLYSDGDRYVFLGAKQRKAGDNSLAYGANQAADVVGVVERVGNFRWRMALAGAAPGQLDLYELTPVPPEQQPKG